MKLQAELANAVSRAKAKGATASSVRKAKENMIATHSFVKDPETRLAWAMINGIYSTDEICNMYRKYGCNNDHITSLGKAVIRVLERV